MQNPFRKKFNQHRALLQAAEYRHFMTLRLVNLLLMTMFALFIFGGGIFMYQRIYNTIGQIQVITVLRSQLGAEAIDFANLEDIEAGYTKKYSDNVLTPTRDPFHPVVVVTEDVATESPVE